MIDLSICNPGDILISSRGAIFTYVAPTPFLHFTYQDHVVRMIKDRHGRDIRNNTTSHSTKTNDGFSFKYNRMPKFDEDIVKIIKPDDKCLECDNPNPHTTKSYERYCEECGHTF